MHVPSRNQRAWSWLAILSLAFWLSAVSLPSMTAAWAYQEDEAAKTDDGTAEAETPAADQQPESSDSGTQPTEPRESFLSILVRASGLFGAVLLLLSFVMVALIMMNILQVRRENLLPAAFVESFEQKLNANDIPGAFELARNDESFVARVLTAGLRKLNRGYAEAIEAMQEVGEDENMAMEHRLSYLALIGSVAPMIGLMGTVWGMIGAFEEIARAEVSPKPKDLAQDIYTALFTTLEGLGVAIPAIAFYSILKNRVARFMLEVGIVSEGLMSRFSTVGRPKSSGGSASAS